MTETMWKECSGCCFGQFRSMGGRPCCFETAGMCHGGNTLWGGITQCLGSEREEKETDHIFILFFEGLFPTAW